MSLIVTARQISREYHYLVHLLFGLISLPFFPETNLLLLVIIVSLGTYLPDLDHLFCIFLYGQSSPYAKKFKKLLTENGLSSAADFCKHNHKKNTGVYSHNLLTSFIFLLLVIIFSKINYPYLASFFLAGFLHFTYDIIEDLFLLGKLNSNWLLKFKSNPNE